MLKKIVISILALTVVGSGAAAGAYSYAQSQAAPAVTGDISYAEEILTGSQPQTQGNGFGQQAAGQQAAGQAQNPVPMAEGLVGEPFEAAGFITLVDLNGVELATETGESIYVELGPQDYLLSQGIELLAGDEISVTGMVNEEMYHAIDLILRSTGETVVLRTADGQPMWSGGISNGNGNSNGSADGSHTPDPQAQVAPEDWLSLSGTLLSLTRGQMTIQAETGEQVSFQSGQPRFFESQGVVFNIGDQVSVYGYYLENGQFVAGDITQISTGLKVMLRDPNGRPLWAGPGGNGNGGSNSAPTTDSGVSN